MKLDPKKTALAVGIFAGGWHVVWAVLIMLGWAQPLQDFMFQIHMLNNPFTVVAFNLGTAAVLVITTFAIGFLFGWVFANIWNRVQKAA